MLDSMSTSQTQINENIKLVLGDRVLLIASQSLKIALDFALKIFPRPKFEDEDKTRAAAVLVDFYALLFVYGALDFALVFRYLRPLGIQQYAIYLVTVLVARHFAYKGNLKFSAAFFTGCIIWFYLIITARLNYFEHAQAANLTLLVIYFTITLGPKFGFWVLLFSVSVLTGLFLVETEGIFLYPLNKRMTGLSRYSQEYRTILENTVESYLFCWLVRSHIFSQLQNALIKIKAETRKADLAREVADKAEHLKSQYLIHVNHELRNPLTAIVTSVDMLSKEYATTTASADPGSRTGYFINTIRTTSHHVLSMLNDVLEMERLEGGDAKTVAEPFSARKLIQDVAEIFALSASEAGNTINTRVESGLHDEWEGASSRIRQVLVNLVANAVKHAPKSTITLSISQEATGLVFEVSDNGPGLSDHAREHLFEPFASSLGASGSTGLGLRICKLIVDRQLNGAIEAHSESGKGTTFKLTVPLVRVMKRKQWEYVDAGSTAVQQDDAVEGAHVSAELKGKSLLLVDDDADNLAVIAMALEDVGMRVMTAQSSQEAMELLYSGNFNVTLLDYNLGPLSEMNGIELASKIVGGNAGPVIGYTGNYSEDVDRKWRAAGVKSIVRKPASLRTLTSTLMLAARAA